MASGEWEQGHQEGYELGKQKGHEEGVGCGAVVGYLLAFVFIYMGWCSPYPFGARFME